jgi:coenzyme PQQ synthesis protein D (PqqD)
VELLQIMIKPDDIDEQFAPRRRDELIEVPVGPELVIINSTTGEAHVLNQTGALVWGCYDGQSTLEALALDFSSVADTDADVIRADLMAMTRDMGQLGLLEGVRRTGDDHHPDVRQPEAVEVGAELEPFTLPDMDGTDRALQDFRGRRVLLVNWSPACGFCVKIGGTLAGMQDRLTGLSTDLVFVTIGDPDENRRVFDEAGLTGPALIKQVDVDPFPGFGTPSAYLLDEEGRVSAPMAVGADQVPALAREAAGLDPEPDHEGEEDPTGVRYLPAAAAVCGPTTGTQEIHPKTSWAGTRAYRLGDTRLGVRYNSDETAATLDLLFGDAPIDDPKVQDNYSVALYEPSANGSRELNLLVRGGTQLVRSRSRARVLAGLLAHLSAEIEPPDTTLRLVRATAGVREGEAMLLPANLVVWLKELQPRLARQGIQLVDVPFPSLDVLTKDLVVPEPSIPHDPSVIEVDEEMHLGSELPRIRPGRYPLTDWYMECGPAQTGLLTPAFAVAFALQLVWGTDDLHWVAGNLERVFEQARPRGIAFDGPEALVAELGSCLP